MLLLTKEFHGIESKQYLRGIMLRAMSRVFNTIALFLPLKILILLSSPTMPSYFEFLSRWLTRESFLLIMLSLTPATYLCYLVTGIISNRAFTASYSYCKSKEVNVKGYAIKGNKLKWFHDHCAKGSSELLICLIGIFLIGVVNYIYLASLIFIGGVFFITMLHVLYPEGKEFKSAIFNIPISSFIEYCTAVLYFIIFFIIIIFVYLSVLGLYESLLVLLTSRLIVQSVQKLLVEGFYIDKDLKSLS